MNRPQRFFRTCVLVSVCCTLLGASAAAQEDETDRRRLAITDPAQVDADFAFQGEYRGHVFLKPGDFGHDQMGLQVVAQGDGAFDAVYYPHGLPGAGWNGVDRVKLTGQLENGELSLAGEGWSATILSNGVATVRNARNVPLGILAKFQRESPTIGAPPPAEAEVLFDGTDTEAFVKGEMTPEGFLKVGTQFKSTYQDFKLHLEFRLPYMPFARGQGRANSGVYLQSRYEVQILDSFGLDGAHNECGALYRLKPPDVNVCLPPLVWQTYDIEFRAARFDENGMKTDNTRITVWHNGVKVHDDFTVPRKTGNGSPEGPNPLPIKLQNHSNPVVFRNIWIIDRTKHPLRAPLRETQRELREPQNH